jgi:methyl-accepting chemotaxis protein
MQRLTISARMYCLIALSLAILAGALTFSLFQSYGSAERERKAGLAFMDGIAISVLQKFHALETSGAMTREQAQSEAMKAIGEMRYDGGSGYFWINDMRPFMVMHPINAKLNGADLSQNKDPNGKHLFVEFVNTV